jgi:tetratricopeptide (TPR) repeat protein
MLRRLLLILTVLLALPGSAMGAQNDPRLDELFQRLRAAGNPVEAQVVEVLIWKIWGEAGSRAADSLMRLGEAAMEGGDLGGALSLFDAVTQSLPEFAEGWNKRATVLFLMKEYERSAADVARVLALEPRHFGALSGLGLINMHLDREDAAITAFEQALKVNPNMPQAKSQLDELKKKRAKGNI